MPENLSIKPENVTIDDEGRVVIKDAAVAAEIQKFLADVESSGGPNDSLVVGTNGVGCSC